MIILLQALTGMALLYLGGEGLVRGAVAVASRLGISALAIGLTVVSFGTSAPELAVSLNAAMTGAMDISVGNVVGSNITNIGLILALAALISPLIIKAKIIRIDVPIMLASVILSAFFLMDGRLNRWEGLILLVGLILYTLFTFIHSRKEPDIIQEEFAHEIATAKYAPALDVGLILLGLALLFLGGKLLVIAAVDFAVQAGVSEAVIGLTIVAIGTSLPEMTATLIAARRGYADMAIGNIIGSNIFNVLGILGITALVSPLETGNIRWEDIFCMVALCFLTSIFLYTRNKLDRYEAAILLLIFISYISWLI